MDRLPAISTKLRFPIKGKDGGREKSGAFSLQRDGSHYIMKAYFLWVSQLGNLVFAGSWI